MHSFTNKRPRAARRDNVVARCLPTAYSLQPIA